MSSCVFLLNPTSPGELTPQNSRISRPFLAENVSPFHAGLRPGCCILRGKRRVSSICSFSASQANENQAPLNLGSQWLWFLFSSVLEVPLVLAGPKAASGDVMEDSFSCSSPYEWVVYQIPFLHIHSHWIASFYLVTISYLPGLFFKFLLQISLTISIFPASQGSHIPSVK